MSTGNESDDAPLDPRYQYHGPSLRSPALIFPPHASDRSRLFPKPPRGPVKTVNPGLAAAQHSSIVADEPEAEFPSTVVPVKSSTQNILMSHVKRERERVEMNKASKIGVSLPARLNSPTIPNLFQNISSAATNISESSSPEKEKPYMIMIDADKRVDYLEICVPLYQAAMNGDWQTAENIIKEYPGVVRVAITKRWETVLHIAAAAKRTEFVVNLVGCMNQSDLALRNKDGNTAICFAAASGIVEIAKVMVDKNKDLPLVRGNRGVTPLYMAALFGHKKMVLYLKQQTVLESLTREESVMLFLATISADMYDIALEMLEKDPLLAVSRNQAGEIALHLMARKASAFASKSHLGLLKSFINSNFKQVFDEAPMQTLARQLTENLWKLLLKVPDSELSDFIREPTRLLFDAAAIGNVEFLIILIRSYPDLIWKVDHKNQSLFHIAALNRQESVFNVIYELGAIKDLIASYKDDHRNSMLHLVSSEPPQDRLQIVSGAALQMQRELLWFEAVKKVVPPSYIKMRNSEGKLPQDIFTEQHLNLRKEGETWMKDTATSCMLVATLIATVVFAAAFTVPGGNNSEKGTPILQREKLFTIFLLSDAVAMFSASTSIVVFLSILTSHFAESDFLVSLPSRLMIGLSTLFVSIITMVMAFSAALLLTYNQEFDRTPMLIVSLASITALSFAWLHRRLLFNSMRSTYWSKFLFDARNPRLYKQ